MTDKRLTKKYWESLEESKKKEILEAVWRGNTSIVNMMMSQIPDWKDNFWIYVRDRVFEYNNPKDTYKVRIKMDFLI